MIAVASCQTSIDSGRAMMTPAPKDSPRWRKHLLIRREIVHFFDAMPATGEPTEQDRMRLAHSREAEGISDS